MIDQGEKMAAHLLNKCHQTGAELKRKYGRALDIDRSEIRILKCDDCGQMINIGFAIDSNPSKKYELPCSSCETGIMREIKF